MRAIQVSTEVFAEIWKRHQPGDLDEDQILRRLLDLGDRPAIEEPGRPVSPASPTALGYEDVRYAVKLPEGFEIFRTYKGREYRARATGGRWLLLTTNETFPSLNKLSWAVVNNHENTWHNWKFKTDTGGENFIHALRDSSTVTSRV